MNRYFYALAFALLLTSLHAQTYSISGQITNPYGTTLCDVAVSLTEPSGSVQTTLTDGNGNYTFENITGSVQGIYSLVAEKDENALNGVSTLDIVILSRHILGIQLLAPHQRLAMDVNGSSTLTTLDMVHMRRLILGIDANFPIASWRIFASSGDWPLPGSVNAPNPAHTFTGLDADKTGLDFFGAKTGDSNGTATGVCN